MWVIDPVVPSELTGRVNSLYLSSLARLLTRSRVNSQAGCLLRNSQGQQRPSKFGHERATTSLATSARHHNGGDADKYKAEILCDKTKTTAIATCHDQPAPRLPASMRLH